QMAGSGTTVLGPAIPLTISGAASISLADTRTLRTEGPVTWTGDADLGGGFGTTFENGGTLTSSGPGVRNISLLTFRNTRTGTLVHDGGTLRFSNGPVENLGVIRIEDGTVETVANVANAGRTEIAETGRLAHTSATHTFTEAAEVAGTGTVALVAPVTNRATWRPGGSAIGTITVDSDWPAMEPEGTINFVIGGSTPGTEFDQLSVAGTFAAGGTIRVTLINGFRPQEGDRFLIVPAASGATGTFDTEALPQTTPAGYIQTTSEGVFYGIGTPVANEDAGPGEALPTAFALGQPYPNPVAQRAALTYDVPEAARVRLVLYDVLGRAVTVLVEGEHAAGRHTATLDAAGLPSGVYVARLEAPAFAQTQRLTVVR
ncbi:MAG: T9SS type A sorting domain-containing protein, partial [Bacteroidota bacterium]